MTSPPPLRSKANKNAGQNIDYSMTAPLEASGSNFPCKGYLDDTEGKESVATWKAGSSQTVTITGGANHNGGSCQLSISEDEGKTFKVIKSFEGNCPANTGEVTLNVDIPKDVKDGDVVFAWTWNNRVGNREFYMNCAMVTIEDGGAGLDQYPDMFVAQLSSINSCTIEEGVDVKYPNPGDQVETADGDSALGDPTGDCGSKSGGSGGGSSGGSGSGSSAGGSGATGSSSAGGAGATVSASVSLGGASASGSASAPAGSGVPCDNEGETRCDSETTWSVCGSGLWQNMGSTAAGMKCVNGSMALADGGADASSSPAASARALRGSRAFVSHKRHWNSRRHA
ncbi:hypothetical protein HDZ31DRAFT_33191 [Schizophyllum fasciatum]